MAVPRFVRRYRSSNFAGAVAVAGLLGAVTMPALGQTRDGYHRNGPADRMPLGGPPVVQAVPEEMSSTDRATVRADSAAARLLGTARQDLAQGQTEIAQRVLEQLVARYPDSLSAADARRELYLIYAANRGMAPPTPATRSTFDAQAADQPTDPIATRPSVSEWRTSVIRFARPQEELRNGIGDRVFFSAGSADLGSRARAVIAAQAEWLRRRSDLDIVVEGHADDASAGADDEQLSASRAIAVRDRLAAEGVAPARIRVVPQGARDPIATCDDAMCAAQNRRALVQVELPRSQEPGNSFGAVGHDASNGGRPR